ncbi:MAG TPA: CBS domain-containing protein [Candidatus Bathyarchaeia archaeon]|nr:CBS domain-containing protein [Candidatus Bathyarchaeia archaeon]
MIASEVMTRDPVSVGPGTSVAQVWNIMREMEIRHVPVVERGKLLGIVSDRDLARVDVAGILSTEGADALRQELATPVVRIMSADVISIDTDTELSDAVELLIEHKVGALPVVEPETRELRGILSYIDVLRALLELLEED